jgi:hypothetical protein
VLGQIGCQPSLLVGAEVVAVAAHQAQQAAVLAARSIQLPPAARKWWLMSRRRSVTVGSMRRLRSG